MKIMEIIPDVGQTAGAERFFVSLIKHFSKDGFECRAVLLYRQTNSVLEKELASIGIEVKFLNKRPGVDLRAAKLLRNEISDFCPDIIHTHRSSLLTLFLSKPKKVSKAIMVHTFHNIASKETSKNKYFFMRWLLKIHYFIPVGISPSISDTISTYYHISNVYTINNGVDLSSFSSSIPACKRPIDVINVARFSKQKNHSLLIASLAPLIRKGVINNVAFLGDGEEIAECKKLVVALSCTRQIHFYGSVSNVNDYLSHSKIFVLSSDYEGSPISIPEAMASGCAIVSTSVGGVPDMLTSSNALLVPPKDKESLTQALRRLILDKELLSRLSITNTRDAQAHSIIDAAKSYEGFFVSLMTQKNDL